MIYNHFDANFVLINNVSYPYLVYKVFHEILVLLVLRHTTNTLMIRSQNTKHHALSDYFLELDWGLSQVGQFQITVSIC